MRLGDGTKAPRKRKRKKTVYFRRTLNKLVSYAFFFQNHNLPSSRCQATRQAVVFTAEKKKKKEPRISLETDPVFAHRVGDSTRPLSQGCKLL